MIGALVAGITGSGGAVLSSYESIATATGTGSSGTITFSSIPGTYTHLQIRGIARSDYTTGNYVGVGYRCNGDTANNYSGHYLAGNGASASAYGWSSQNQSYGPFTTTVNAGSNTMAAFVIDILDYANTNKYKTIRTLNGYDNNASGTSDFDKGAVEMSSGLWMSTSAITSFSILVAANWTTTTTFALYGIKESA